MTGTDQLPPRGGDQGCLESLEMVYAYLDGELRDPDAVARFEHHLEHCRSCWSRLQMERLLSERLRRAGETRAPEALRARLRDILDQL